MAYTLTLNSITPVTAINSGTLALTPYFTLSGSGISFPGFSLGLYNALIGGTLIKSLYEDDNGNPTSGDGFPVSFSGVMPGTYYVEMFYRVKGIPRKSITITGPVNDVNNISLNGTKIITNTLNGSNMTRETLNGTVVYES